MPIAMAWRKIFGRQWPPAGATSASGQIGKSQVTFFVTHGVAQPGTQKTALVALMKNNELAN